MRTFKGHKGLFQTWLAENYGTIPPALFAVLDVLANTSTIGEARTMAGGLLDAWDGHKALADRCGGLAELCRLIDSRDWTQLPTTTDAGDAGGRK